MLGSPNLGRGNAPLATRLRIDDLRAQLAPLDRYGVAGLSSPRRTALARLSAVSGPPCAALCFRLRLRPRLRGDLIAIELGPRALESGRSHRASETLRKPRLLTNLRAYTGTVAPIIILSSLYPIRYAALSDKIIRSEAALLIFTRGQPMPTVTTKDGVEIFYKDWGQGQPIVFHHGWPLSSDDWDTQMLFFVLQRVPRRSGIDRRGHGRSSQVSDGHDMDHYAADAAAVVEHLDLRNAVHIGHSTGGGEASRYVARHGKGRVAKTVLMSAVPPIMVKIAEQSRRLADRGVRRLSEQPGRQPRPVLSTSRRPVPSTDSTGRAPSRWRA